MIKKLRIPVLSTMLATSVLVTVSACAVSGPGHTRSAPSSTTASAVPAAAGQGLIVSTQHVTGLSAARTRRFLISRQFGSPLARDGIDMYRLRYRTTGTTGAPTTASGLIAVPRTRSTAMSVVSYEHGTTVPENAVATVDTTGYDAAAAAMFASAGYLTVAPDYLGLGSGPGTHPYMDHAAEVTASLDLLRAARTFARQRGIRLRPDVRVTGFSQGGTAAMALGQALQLRELPGFGVAAVAPVSGPYDLQRDELPIALNTRQLDGTEVSFYIAYLTVAWSHVYPGAVPAHPFTSRYTRLIPRVFDGKHSYNDIYAALPADVRTMITPQWLANLVHPSGRLLQALRRNDRACTWIPRVPVHIWAAHGDRDVAFANARTCQSDLAARGTTATITDVGNLDHNHSALVSFPQVLRWFATV